MDTPNDPKPDSPAVAATPAPAARIGRVGIAINVLVQILVAFFILMLVNYLTFRHFWRWDNSRNQKFALSSQTKNVLAHLDAPVHAIIFFPQAQMLSGDVISLLREYEYASKGKFVTEQVDPYRNLIRARELSEKYKFGSSDNIVILDYKGKSKFVNAQDMAEMDQSGMAFGQPPVIKSFKGEEAMTSAMMEITEEKQNKLYMVNGHGELLLQDPQLSQFKAYLQRQNIKSDELNLNNVNAVPADATGLLLFGPKQDFSDREIKLIGDFWTEKKGRLFILLNAAAKTPRLNSWLSAQGIAPQGDRILKTGMGLAQDDNGQMVLRSGVISSPGATFVPGGKAVTKDLAAVDTQLYGATESLVLDLSKAETDKIQLTSVLESAEGYWGSTTYLPGETKQVFFDPKKDHLGPLVIAVAAEQGALADKRVQVETGRMVVVGNSGFLTDEGLRVADAGLDFALNSINWMFNREQIAGIAAKPKEPVKLSLDERKMLNLRDVVVFSIPMLAAVLGIAVWWQRRS